MRPQWSFVRNNPSAWRKLVAKCSGSMTCVQVSKWVSIRRLERTMLMMCEGSVDVWDSRALVDNQPRPYPPAPVCVDLKST